MSNFWDNKKILVTGGSGFLGSWVVRTLLKHDAKPKQITVPRRAACDLRLIDACREAVRGQNVVIHLAGRVGGIGYNQQHPGELLYDNLLMSLQMVEAARQMKVQKFVFVSSVCAYPKFTPVPFRETDLWNGYPEETNAPYGLAKKIPVVQIHAYESQYGFHGISLLPVNMYGPGDNFNSESSHVIPALIRRMVEAKKTGASSITVWGTGTASREFLYVGDAAEGIVLAAEKYESTDPVNLGSGQEITIKELVGVIAREVDYRGEIVWDATKPDGQPRRMLDTTRAADRFGFRAQTSFEEGLKKTIAWYKEVADIQI